MMMMMLMIVCATIINNDVEISSISFFFFFRCSFNSKGTIYRITIIIIINKLKAKIHSNIQTTIHAHSYRQICRTLLLFLRSFYLSAFQTDAYINKQPAKGPHELLVRSWIFWLARIMGKYCCYVSHFIRWNGIGDALTQYSHSKCRVSVMYLCVYSTFCNCVV